MESEEILEPLDEYEKVYRQKSIDEANNYFDELVKKANLDQNANAETADRYYKKEAEYNAAKSKADSSKTLKGFLIALAVILFIVGIVLIVLGVNAQGTSKIIEFIIGPVLIVLGIVDLVLVFKKLSKVIEKRQSVADKLLQEANEIKKLCYQQMAELNSLFDWSDTAKIVKKVTPLLQLDDKFDDSKYIYLKRKYGIDIENSKDVSNFFVLSGSIVGNPFLVERLHEEKTVDKAYTGSIVITWTTTSRDSKGNVTTQHHSQTLTATIYKPCPTYSFKTFLVYGNDAAERLSFSRNPTVNVNSNEKDIQKQVKRTSKQLDKLAEKALTDNDDSTNFTKMGNDEFDSLFHAIDRDDETQFRLLFTPLAQVNMVKLLKSKAPYGDDFSFIKNKQLNYIFSSHAQSQNIYSNPKDYTDFDCRNARKKFVDYNFSFFRSLYFDLAPLLCIPLYQQTKSVETIYGSDAPDMNVSPFEQESLANSLPGADIDPVGASTRSIRKTTYLGSEGEIDKVQVTSYAFKGTPMVEYVTKMGGDGRFHEVPVHWVKYDPIQRTSFLGIQNYESTQHDYSSAYANEGFQNAVKILSSSSAIHFERRLLAYVIPSNGKDVPNYQQFREAFQTKDSK